MNKVVEQAKQEKAVNNNLSFQIALAAIIMVTLDKKTTKEEPKAFNKAWNHLDVESQTWGNMERVWQYEKAIDFIKDD